MKIIEFKGHKVELYDNADQLPIKRYQRFNKYLMIDNEVGSTFDDFDRRNLSIIELLKKDMKQEAIIEMENRRQMVFNAFQEYSPKNLALAILVHSIDDIIYIDYSDESLSNISKKLDEIGFTKFMMDDNVSEVKKKSKNNWTSILKTVIKVIPLKLIVRLLKNLKLKLKR